MSSDSGNFAPWKFIKDKKVFAHQLCQGSTWISLCLVNQKCQIMSKKNQWKAINIFFPVSQGNSKRKNTILFYCKDRKDALSLVTSSTGSSSAPSMCLSCSESLNPNPSAPIDVGFRIWLSTCVLSSNTVKCSTTEIRFCSLNSWMNLNKRLHQPS